MIAVAPKILVLLLLEIYNYNNRITIEVDKLTELEIVGSELSSSSADIEYELISEHAEFISVKEYAALYGITETKVRSLLEKGLFFSVKYISMKSHIFQIWNYMLQRNHYTHII